MHAYEIQRMSQCRRWTIIETMRPQSLLEHSAAVAMLTGEMCRRMQMPDMARYWATEWALIHDRMEIFTGDIPAPFKRKLEEVGVSTDILMANTLHDDEWHQAKDRCSAELLYLVKFADLTESYAYVKMYGTGVRAQAAIKFMERAWIAHRDGGNGRYEIEAWYLATEVAQEYLSNNGVGRL